jgi:SAM-dependent methyltransferase
VRHSTGYPAVTGRCVGCGSPTAGGWLCPVCDEKARTRFLSLQETSSDQGYDSELFALLEQAEPRSFWFRARNELIVWCLEKYFSEAHELLEIGCGTGFVLQAIRRERPSMQITGLELFPEGIEVARRRLPRVRLLQLDARKMEFESDFDVVAALDTLEHIREDELVLERAASALRRGGGMLITVPQHPWLWGPADTYAHHERRYRAGELAAKIERAGLEVVRTTSFVSLLMPFLVASRWRPRFSGRTYDLARELYLPRRVDRAFELVGGLERALIKRGLSFPAGGSLLVVARKH